MQQPPPPNPSPLPSTKTQRNHHKRHLTKPNSASTSASTSAANSDAALLSLLRQRKTDEAYRLYSLSPTLPSPTCLSRLVAQLSYRRDSPSSLHRARSIVRRLRDLRQLHRLDSNSLGLLASSAATSSNPSLLPFALSLLRSLLLSHYLPHVLAYTAVVSRLSNSPEDDAPRDALDLFDSVLLRLRQLPHPSLSSHARPDTAAFNAALNAAANVPDIPRFVKLFDEMREFDVEPDVLSFNVAIKMCARAGRSDLLPFVLETILRRGIAPCPTTMHSLVAAYVGFGDLPAAERLVQCLREGRLDLCAELRSLKAGAASANMTVTEESRLLEALVRPDGEAPLPLLPRRYVPDTRIYTILMKGYMKEGRVNDVIMMIRAMQREPEPASRPDHVTYTTAISALVEIGDLDRARSMLAEMVEVKIPPNRITYNILLKGYCRQLQLESAKELLEEMASRTGVEPNEVTYNTLIDGCILNDDSAGALKYFNEMRERGIAPSKVSYTTLMKAFALSAQPRLAHKVFDEMAKDPRVKVDRVAWNMLVEGYCRLGLLDEAKKLIEKMKDAGFEPDVATYGSLANAVALARKPGEALLLWNEVKERCGAGTLRPDEGLLDTLADVCVRAAFFKKALEIVACMEENGIPPNKTKYKRIYVEMHSRMFTSKHASMARQQRRSERKRAAEAFKFWLGLPNSYYGSEWRIEPMYGDDDGAS